MLVMDGRMTEIRSASGVFREKCDLPDHCIWISFFHLFPHQTQYTLRLCEILVLGSSRGNFK